MLPQELYHLFDIIETPITLVANTVKHLVLNDASRVAIGFGATTTAQIAISTRPNLAAAQGFFLVANTPILYLDHKSYGPLVSLDWYALSAMGVGITTIEVFQRRELNYVKNGNGSTQGIRDKRGHTLGGVQPGQAGIDDLGADGRHVIRSVRVPGYLGERVPDTIERLARFLR